MSPTFDPQQNRPHVTSGEPPSTVDFAGDSSNDALAVSLKPPLCLPEIAGYAITAEIARGGMGRIFAARDLTLDRDIAIKTLLPGADPAPFVSEAKITAKLPHPGIPPAHALGSLADGTPYLAMKLIRGRTLADLLKQRPSPEHDLAHFVQIFEQVAQAVGFAHAQQIIHRDLKPANVMVGEFGEVQVMDWGLAKSLVGPANVANTAAAAPEKHNTQLDTTSQGLVLGTPSYMAPEQARSEAADERTDVFALGAILTVILTGQPVFQGTTVRETIEQAARGDLGEALSRLEKSAADSELCNLARYCLAANPADRPANASLVAADVTAYRLNVAARLRQAETERAESQVRLVEQRKRRNALIAAASIIIVLLTAGLIVIEQSRRAESAARSHAEEAERNQRRQYAQSSFDAGSLALKRGDWKSALQLLEAARNAGFADHVALQLQTATAHARLGNLQEVKPILDQLASAELGKHQGRYLVLRADDDFLGSSDPQVGRDRLTKALASGTLEPAERAYVEGMLAPTFDTAIGKLQQSIELDPFLIESRMMLSALLMFAGRFEEAEQQFEALALIAPQDPGKHTAKALLFAMRGDLPAVKSTLEKLRPEYSAEEVNQIYASMELFASLLKSLDLTEQPKTDLTKYLSIAMKVPQLAKAVSQANPRVRHWAVRAPNHPALAELFKRLTTVVTRVTTFQSADEAFFQVAEIDPDAFFLLNGVNLRYQKLNIRAQLAKGGDTAQKAMEEMRELEKVLLRARQQDSISPNVQRWVLYRLIDIQAMLGAPGAGFPDDPAARQAAAKSIRELLRLYPDLSHDELESVAMASFLIRDLPAARYLTARWVAGTKGHRDALSFQMQLEGSLGDPLHGMHTARELLKLDPKNAVAKEVLESATRRAQHLLGELSEPPQSEK